MSDEYGKTYIFQASREYKLIAVNDLKDKILASPIVIGDDLVIRTEHAVWKIGKSKN